MSEEIRNCPHCGGKSNGIVLYSAPLQTFCSDCEKPYTFGNPAVRIVDDVEEYRRLHPEMYGDKKSET